MTIQMNLQIQNYVKPLNLQLQVFELDSLIQIDISSSLDFSAALPFFGRRHFFQSLFLVVISVGISGLAPRVPVSSGKSDGKVRKIGLQEKNQHQGVIGHGGRWGQEKVTLNDSASELINLALIILERVCISQPRFSLRSTLTTHWPLPWHMHSFLGPRTVL